jgi:hypothetical protein
MLRFRRKAHRGPTLIALRARREALQIARAIAYPEITIPPANPEDPDVQAFREKLEALGDAEARSVRWRVHQALEASRRRYRFVVAVFIVLDVLLLALVAFQLARS